MPRLPQQRIGPRGPGRGLASALEAAEGEQPLSQALLLHDELEAIADGLAVALRRAPDDLSRVRFRLFAGRDRADA